MKNNLFLRQIISQKKNYEHAHSSLFQKINKNNVLD